MSNIQDLAWKPTNNTEKFLALAPEGQVGQHPDIWHSGWSVMYTGRDDGLEVYVHKDGEDTWVLVLKRDDADDYDDDEVTYLKAWVWLGSPDEDERDAEIDWVRDNQPEANLFTR